MVLNLVFNAIDYSVCHTTDTLFPRPHGSLHIIIRVKSCPLLKSSNLCLLVFFVIFPLNFTLQYGVCNKYCHGSFRPHRMSKPSEPLLLNNLQQCVIHLYFLLCSENVLFISTLSVGMAPCTCNRLPQQLFSYASRPYTFLEKLVKQLSMQMNSF